MHGNCEAAGQVSENNGELDVTASSAWRAVTSTSALVAGAPSRPRRLCTRCSALRTSRTAGTALRVSGFSGGANAQGVHGLERCACLEHRSRLAVQVRHRHAGPARPAGGSYILHHTHTTVYKPEACHCRVPARGQCWTTMSCLAGRCAVHNKSSTITGQHICISPALACKSTLRHHCAGFVSAHRTQCAVCSRGLRHGLPCMVRASGADSDQRSPHTESFARWNTHFSTSVSVELFGTPLQLSQDPQSLHLGTTVWDASIVVAKWLERNARWVCCEASVERLHNLCCSRSIAGVVLSVQEGGDVPREAAKQARHRAWRRCSCVFGLCKLLVKVRLLRAAISLVGTQTAGTGERQAWAWAGLRARCWARRWC